MFGVSEKFFEKDLSRLFEYFVLEFCLGFVWYFGELMVVWFYFVFIIYWLVREDWVN